MTIFQNLLPGDLFLLWSINLLVQVTLISLATLLVARCGRRSPAVKWSILCAGLMLVLLCPAIVSLSQATGIGLVSVPLGRQPAPTRTDASSTSAVRMADDSQSQPAARAPDFSAAPVPGDDEVASTAMQMRSPSDMTGKAVSAGAAAVQDAFTPTFQTDAASMVRWLFACVLVAWCCGSALLLIRLLRAWWKLQAIRQMAQAIDAPRVDSLLQGICDDLRVRRMPRVTTSSLVRSPMAVGIWQPQVILPEGLLEQLGNAELRGVLTHEVAHIARRDLVVVFGQNLAVSLFWLHPLVHVLNRQLALAREEVCDNHVLKTIDAPAYSRVLLHMAELIQGQDQLLASVSLLPREWRLESRIAGILNEGRSTMTRLTKRSRVLVLTLSVSIAVIAAQATLTFTDGAEPDAANGAPPAAPTTAAAQDTDPEPSDAPVGTRFQFEGQVVAPDGRPVAGAEIYIAQRGARPLATTDAQGRFQFTRTKTQLPNRAQWGVNRLVAVADGFGPAWLKAIIFDVSGNARRDWEARNPNSRFPKVWEKTDRVLTLVEDDVPIQGRIVDLEGRPVSGVAIQPRFVDDLYARYAFHEVTTNARGEFAVRGVGRNRTVRLVAKGDRIAFSVFFARTEHGPTLTRPSRPIEEEPEFPGDTRNVRVVYSAMPVHAVAPSVPVEGTVTDVDTGQPIRGVTIYAYGLDNNPEVGRREEFKVTTDDRGRYRMTGLPIGFNELLAIGDGTRPYLPGGVAVQTNDQESVHTRDFKLKRGLWLEGRVTDAASGEPVRATVDYFAVSESPSSNRTQDFEESLDGNHCQTDGSGRYRLAILPGPAIVTINASDPRAYPTGIMSDKVAAEYKGGSIPLQSTRALLFPLGFNFLASINPVETTEREELNVQLPLAPAVTVRFVDPDGQPLSGVSVTDYTQSHGLTIDSSSVLNGNVYLARNYLPAQPRRLVAWHPERDLSGQLVIRERPAGDVTFTLQPAATIKGRIVDDDGQPRPARFYRSLTNAPTDLEAGVLTGTDDVFNTNADGAFEFRWLVPGVTYRVAAIHPTEGQFLGLLLDDLQLEAGEVRDLGDVRVQRETP
jgi:beta-lactamase regulating signal transducer with metallopeptidase domain/protocatechuate 3,4-dioxygenase beta subunit